MVNTKWFRNASSEFCTRFDKYKGRPITYVEIGVFQGASAHWVCQNVLTHKNSVGIGIDPYTAVAKRSAESMEKTRLIAEKHLSTFPNWKWIYADSKKAFRRWRRNIDVLYIDGLHEAPMAIQDFVLAFPYLKPGSVVIFDDYGIGQRKSLPCVPEAVAAVLIAFEGMVEPLEHNSRQFAMKVLSTDNLDFRAAMRGNRNLDFTMSVLNEMTSRHLQG